MCGYSRPARILSKSLPSALPRNRALLANAARSDEEAVVASLGIRFAIPNQQSHTCSPGATEAVGRQLVEKTWLPPRDSNPDMLIQRQATVDFSVVPQCFFELI